MQAESSGRFSGYQWLPTPDGRHIDQITYAVEQLRAQSVFAADCIGR